jgi:hypothetical protein
MPSRVQCFLIEPTGYETIFLRRYHTEYPISPEKACASKYGYHNAKTFYARVESSTVSSLVPPSYDDPWWPSHCEYCGFEFPIGDPHQLYSESEYRRADNPDVKFSLRDAPPGAIWNASWLVTHRRREYIAPGNYVGKDGKCLVVKLPDGRDWVVDGPANNGPGWEREGVVPNITVRPSISTPGYHGFLTNGWLEEC